MSLPGPSELVVILIILVLLFGAKRLPELGAAVGKGIRNFKNSVTGKDENIATIEKDKHSNEGKDAEG